MLHEAASTSGGNSQQVHAARDRINQQLKAHIAYAQRRLLPL